MHDRIFLVRIVQLNFFIAPVVFACQNNEGRIFPIGSALLGKQLEGGFPAHPGFDRLTFLVFLGHDLHNVVL